MSTRLAALPRWVARVDQGLQISGIFCNPGAGGCDFELLAVVVPSKQPVAHAANLDFRDSLKDLSASPT